MVVRYVFKTSRCNTNIDYFIAFSSMALRACGSEGFYPCILFDLGFGIGVSFLYVFICLRLLRNTKCLNVIYVPVIHN